MTTHGGELVGEGGSACAASGFLLPHTSCGMEWKPYLRVYIHKMVQTRLPRDQRPTKPVSRPVANTRWLYTLFVLVHNAVSLPTVHNGL